VRGNTLATRILLAVAVVPTAAAMLAPTAPAHGMAPPPFNAEVTAAITQLSQNPPLYSDPTAPLALDPAGVTQVQDAIAAAGTPIYVALLPSRAGKALTVTKQLRDGIRQPGTYVAVTGQAYDSTSDLFDVDGLIQQAFAAKRTAGPAAVLAEFAMLVGERAHGQATATAARSPWSVILLAIIVCIVFGAGYWVFRRRANRRDPADINGAATPAAGGGDS